VHTRLDTALLDPRGKIVEAEREYLSDQAAQEIDVARYAADRSARCGGRDRVDRRAAASGNCQSEHKGRDDDIRAPAHPRSRWWWTKADLRMLSEFSEPGQYHRL